MRRSLKELLLERLKISSQDNVNRYKFHPKSLNQLISIINAKIQQLPSASTELDLNDINTFDINNMFNLFPSTKLSDNITSIKLDKWNVRNVKEMSMMFLGKNKLKKLDLSSWQTLNLESTKYMFCNCERLIDIGDISDWKVDEVKNFVGMFNNCKELKNVGDISKWRVPKDADFTGMFKNCESLENIKSLDSWNLEGIDKLKIKATFKNCSLRQPKWYY